MEKLQLKHLAPYLPYGLKIKHGYWKATLKMDTLGSGNETFSILDVLEGVGNSKLILRPLSDLTKEIEINGKKFIPIERLNLSNSEYPLLIDEGFIFLTDRCDLNMLEITSIYEIYQKLFEWHFDVFNLHSKNLCVYYDELNK